MDQTTKGLLILNALSLIGTLYLAFGKSYFKEKGKNLATKEDIAEITIQVETVKSEIEILTQKKLNFNSEKFKVLIDFYSALSVWADSLTTIDISTETKSVQEFMNLNFSVIKEKYYQYSLAKARMSVFFDDDPDLIIESELLKQVYIDFEHQVKSDGLKQFQLTFTRDQITTENNPNWQDEWDIKQAAVLEFINKSSAERLKMATPMFKKMAEFTTLIFQRITSLTA